MRVLFLHRHAYEKGIGGITEYLHYLPLSLKAQGIDVVFYYEGSKSMADIQGPRLMQNGTNAYSGPFIKPGFFILRRKLQPLIELCHNEKIDLIHAQGTYRSGYLAMQLSRHTGIPYIVTSHSDIVSLGSQRMRRPNIQRRCRYILEKAAFVTHLSPMMAEISHQIYDTSEKSAVIGNGIDELDWQRYTTLAEQNYILGIGRLEPEKGFHVLIDAYAELCEKGVRTLLVIAGCGSAETALRRQAQQYGLNLVTELEHFSSIQEKSVVFTGYVRGPAKKQLMAQSKMILFPVQTKKWEEPFGIVQIEAMAAGKPIVASETKATRYLQSLGMQAIMVPADAPSAWAENIQRLLLNSVSRLQMGKTNLENAGQFDWSLIAKQYRDVYVRFR